MIAFGIPGGWEWLVILAIVLLLFGHRLPGMARSLGSGITEFKRGLKDGDKTDGDKPDGAKQVPGSDSASDGTTS
ncbi:MAG: twin-arginine translocase TatA/TatE family subunit [Planctomycetota bacterium]